MTRRLSVILFLAWGTPLQAARVAVLADDDLTVYRSVITGFSIEARAEIDEYNLKGDVKLGDKVAAELAARKPDALVAVGPKSTNLLRQKFPGIPLIHCMVPNVGQYDLSAPNISGVSLEPPVKEQFAALRALMPGVKKVGVVFDPRHSGVRLEEADAAASALGLTLVQAHVQKPEDVPAALKGLGAVEAVWTPADATVLTVVGLDALGDFSRTQKVPVYGVNANQVQRGAFMTLALDYPHVGRQVGRLCNKVLADPKSMRGMPLQAPEGLELALNLTVLKRLALDGAPASALDLAAEKHYSIQAFK